MKLFPSIIFPSALSDTMQPLLYIFCFHLYNNTYLKVTKAIGHI